METEAYTIMTDVGLAKEAAAWQTGTPLQPSHIAWGDGEYEPNGSETALHNEQGRAEIMGSGSVEGALNRVFFQVLLGWEEGPFVIREAGLFDVDGDLLAITKFPLPQNKAQNSSELLIRIDAVFSNLENLTLEIVSSNLFVPSSRKINAGAGLKGGGDLTEDRDFEIDFATPAEVLAGIAKNKVVSPAELSTALGKGADGLPKFLDLNNSGQTAQNIPPNVATRCDNMAVVSGNMAELWNGHRFTVDEDSLGVYGILNRLNTNNETGEGAQTWKNGVKEIDYQLNTGAGTANVFPFTHFVNLTSPGDYIEFYHRHYSSVSRTNNGSKAQIYRLSPYVPPVEEAEQ